MRDYMITLLFLIIIIINIIIIIFIITIKSYHWLIDYILLSTGWQTIHTVNETTDV